MKDFEVKKLCWKKHYGFANIGKLEEARKLTWDKFEIVNFRRNPIRANQIFVKGTED